MLNLGVIVTLCRFDRLILVKLCFCQVLCLLRSFEPFEKKSAGYLHPIFKHLHKLVWQVIVINLLIGNFNILQRQWIFLLWNYCIDFVQYAAFKDMLHRLTSFWRLLLLGRFFIFLDLDTRSSWLFNIETHILGQHNGFIILISLDEEFAWFNNFLLYVKTLNLGR